ncbi:hemolysin III family protein [soil metagenome]
MEKTLTTQSFKEEVLNSLTHGLGFILSIAGLLTLILLAYENGSAWHITSLAVYGASLTLLYGASTLYHSVKPGKTKQYLRIFDHAAIYVLIAGSYTPFALITLREHGGIPLFFVLWGITVVGVIFKFFFVGKFNLLSTILYLLMGWMAVFVYEPLFNNLPFNGLWLLVGGGLSYSFGVIFYLWDRLPFNHSIWHLFVMGGSFMHFLAVYYSCLPQC